MKEEKRATFAFLAFCFLAYMHTGINTIVQTLANTFADLPIETIRLISTLPNAAAVITSFISALLVGRKIKFKTIYITACIFFTIGGLTPLFLHQKFIYLLILRIIFGCGTGCCLSYNAYAMSYYSGEKGIKMMGLALFMCNVGSVAAQLVCGALAEIKWTYSFLTYLIDPVVLVIVILFLQEPDKVAENNQTGETMDSRPSFSIDIILYILIATVSALWIWPINSGISTFLAERTLGGSFESGIILSCYTVAGALAGYIINSLKKMGKFAVGFEYALVAIGFLIIEMGKNIFIVGFGVACCGFGYMASKPLYILELGKEVNFKAMTTTSTILLGAANLGMFLSNAWISTAQKMFGRADVSEIDRSFLAGMVMFAVTAVFFIIFYGKKYRRRKHAEE